MKFRPANVQIWFLDADLVKSAEYLCDAALDKTIDGCMAALVNAKMYAHGIRNKRAYQYYFSADNRRDTLDRVFPDWPFRKQPQLKYYTSRASKWTRMCREHAGYVLSYMGSLADEYQYRRSRPHPQSKFVEWAESSGLSAELPASGQSNIVLPWKSLKMRFRRKDIIEGYRLQYIDTFLWQDPFGAYGGSNRDIPDFVVKKLGLDTASMVT